MVQAGDVSLVAFEREIIRIAPDHEVAQLRAVPGGDGRDASGKLAVTPAEAAALEGLNATRKGFCKRAIASLALSKYCGLVRFRDRAGKVAFVVEVLPKVWGAEGARAGTIMAARRALLCMLGAARNLSISELDTAPQVALDNTLLDLFIRSFLRDVLNVAKGGLLTRYVDTVADLSALRGRFLFADTGRLAATRPGLYRCAYDELTVDNSYNCALLAALTVVRSRITRAATERLWIEARTFFGDVSPVRMEAREVAALKRGRETVRYHDALRWCEVLLDLLAPSLAAGKQDAPALLFDMEALFERWVERREQRRHGGEALVRFKGRVLDLAHIDDAPATNAFRLTPDVLVWRRDQNPERDPPEVVVDAKWKILDPTRKDWRVDEKDVYQLLAYLTRFGGRRARLSYPVLTTGGGYAPPPPVFRIDLPGGEAATIEVDLVPIDVL